MAERAFIPPIRAKDWPLAQAQLNQRLQLISRIFRLIETGPGIPSSRLVQGTKIDGVEAGADVTEDHQADIVIDNITDGTTHKKLTSAKDTKVDGIEAGADVTGDHSADVNALLTQNAPAEASADVTATHQAATIASQGALATLNSVTAAIDIENALRKIYDNTLTANATSVTLSSLSGDTDLHYFISARWVKNGTAVNNFGLQLNADAGVSNYGWTTIYSDGNGYNDNTYFMLWMGRADTDGYISEGKGWLEAGSGFYRNLQGIMSREVGGVAMGGMYAYSDYWWNTANAISSIVFLSEVATGLKIGTRLEVWKRVGV